MNVFVFSTSFQAFLVAAKNNMAQSHGRRRPENPKAPAKKKPNDAALNLDDSPHQGHPAAGKPGQGNKNEPQQGRRKRPQVAAHTNYYAHGCPRYYPPGRIADRGTFWNSNPVPL